MKARTSLAGLLAGALLAGCTTLGPDYQVPASALVNAPGARGALDTAGNPLVDGGQEVPDAWWHLYNDATLNALVQEALTANADLRVANLNLRRAAVIESLARSEGGFSASAATSADRALISGESLLKEDKLPTYTVAQGGIQASYELDLFGKVKRGAEAAAADTEAAAAARDLVRITVVSQVTQGYLDLCEAAHDRRITQDSVQLQQRAVDIAQHMLDAGRGNTLQVVQARTLVTRTQASLSSYDRQSHASQYQLAALLGKLPGQLPEQAKSCQQAPVIDVPLPVGDGVALLRRRPDVRQAERGLAAATARIGVAMADLYPSVSFGASAGTNGLLADYGKNPALYWSIGPMITWHIPTRESHERVELARIGAETELAQFDRTVLQALTEVQVALSDYASSAQHEAKLEQSLSDAGSGAALAKKLYEAGKTPYLDALEAERLRVEAESALASAHHDVSQAQVKLFLALGGGWQTPS